MTQSVEMVSAAFKDPLTDQTMNFHDHWWELTNEFHELS